MALNLDLIGHKAPPVPFSYDEDDVILYALGIGSGVDELDFVYEKNLKVYPTFAAVLAQSASIALTDNLGLNMPAVLYAGQKIVLYGPIPVAGTIMTTAVCSAIYDKGDKGAVINVDLDSRDQDGRLLFSNHIAIIDRSAGNFGGQHGPKAERLDPPQDRGPDFLVEYQTWPNQAALYRLSGDKNPLHVDPDFAALAGLDRPILHGLCVFGMTGRAVVQALFGGQPAGLGSFSARFTGIFYPGEKLIVEGWNLDQNRFLVQARNQAGRVVLGQGLVEAAG
ncbi:MAG: MaoC family dehydratase N-terminal domain-containing protein [Deltaproteobacteria bacterium]|nr:MaoC family dehydratase N-terminal domain-containing protein [Deltaproteobacteria bacterium]